MVRLVLLMLICLVATMPSSAQDLDLMSPDRSLKLVFKMEAGQPHYQLFRFGRPLINSSKLGLKLSGNVDLSSNLEIVRVDRESYDNTWTQVWGEAKEIRNHYQQLTVILENSVSEVTYDIVFRLFDDGFAFRYRIPKQKTLKSIEVLDEISEFAFTEDLSTWWIPAYQGNRYEYLYKNTPLSAIPKVHTPVTFENKDGLCISIHEAALLDYSSMTLAPQSNHTLKADLVPWNDGILVKTKAPMDSPWRAILVADNPGGLVTNYMVLNLNEPCRIKDTSWIKPGKYVGIWWEMHLDVSTWSSGERHGATTANTKRYIDFASKYGFDGVLVEGWNLGWDGDWYQNRELFNFTKPYDDYDIDFLSKYALDKGVRLIGHHETATGVMNYEKQLSDAYKFASKHGMRAVKTGYVGSGQCVDHYNEAGEMVQEWHHGQFMVRHYQKTVEEAAKHKIMLDIHEPIKDTGLRRTWPNLMTREGARGQEYNAWDPEGGNPPEHTVILPFTRMVSGPFDFTPGIFDLLYPEAKPKNRVNTTLTKQLALYVVLFSPLQMAADLPQNYEARPDIFKFIKDVPADWSDTRVLHGRIGDYITVARKDRHSEDWYLGSITDENGRNLETCLSFLDGGRDYVAEIYKDGPYADWQNKPYDYVIEEALVRSDSVFKMRLAPGGGMAIRFRPADESDKSRLSILP